MTTRIPSVKPILIACVMLAMVGASPARAATLVAYFDQTPTVGDAFTVTVDFHLNTPPPYYVQKYEALVSYDPMIVQPQRVWFSSELGDPDVRSWAFNPDPIYRSFIPDQFGAGDAWTFVGSDYDPLYPDGGVETIRLNAYSLIIEELRQPGLMTFFTVTFDTLRPGTSPLTVSYRLNNDWSASQALCVGVVLLQSCSLNVQPVPEPSTMLMMLAGAPWALARMRRRTLRR